MPERNPNISDWFYVPAWSRMPLPENFNNDEAAARDLSVLIFLDEWGCGAGLVELVRRAGGRATAVRAGAGFQQINEDFVIDPDAKEDYLRLWKALAASGRTPGRIVHLWCLTRGEDELSDEDSCEFVRRRGFNSLLFLTQSIGGQTSVELKIVCDGLHQVTGLETLAPSKALLMGPSRVIAKEFSNIRSANIDLTGQESAEECARLLLKEISSRTNEAVVCYRDSQRWVQSIEHAPLPPLNAAHPGLREGGVYLITGGLGGIGLALAEYLAQSIRAKLVLISRGRLPAREQWQEWLTTHEESDAVSQKIRKIQLLESYGGEVLVVNADVADFDQMKIAVDQAKNRFGTIHGVVHGAGVSPGGMMLLKKPEAAVSVMAPKVKGTLVLAELFRDGDLDFCVFCSSVSAIYGDYAQVDYSAANAFLDAYARKYGQEKRILAINWNMWREVGMGVNSQVPVRLQQHRDEELRLGISPDEGKEAFARILAGSLPQVIVSPREITIRGYKDKEVESAAQVARVASDKRRRPRPDLPTEYVVPANPTERTIAEMWQDLLGIDTVGVHDNFFELGGSSALIPGVISRMKSAFSVGLPPADVLENPTVHLLSEGMRQGRWDATLFEASRSRAQRRREAREMR